MSGHTDPGDRGPGGRPTGAIEAGFTPEPELLVSDLDTLRVLADPLRLRILEVFEAHPGMALTVKTVAGALGEPPTRLYYHVNLLEQHGLLVVVQHRVVSGILEKQYRLSADSIRVERALLSGSGGIGEEARALLDMVYGTSRRNLELALRAGEARIGVDEDSPQGILLSRSSEILTPTAAAEARRLLADVVARIHALAATDAEGSARGGQAVAEEAKAPDATPRQYALLIAFHPLAVEAEPRAAGASGEDEPTTANEPQIPATGEAP